MNNYNCINAYQTVLAAGTFCVFLFVNCMIECYLPQMRHDRHSGGSSSRCNESV